MKVTYFGIYWIAWILAFLIPELYWVFKNSANTLSEEVWGLEKLSLSRPFDLGIWTWEHWVVTLVVWLLFLWLSLHFPFGLLR